MTDRPNVVWVCLDQFPQVNRRGPSGVEPFWSSLDSSFAVFNQAYTVLPICSPARASMLTGLYPHTHGLTENDGRFGGRQGLTPDDWLLNRPFLDAGYRTALFGKWHLDNERDASSYGFEGFSLPDYGYPYGSDAYRDYRVRHNLPEPIGSIELPGECGAVAGTRINLSEITNWPEFEAGTMTLEGPAELHEAFFVVDEASRWVEENAEAPFFVSVNTWGPHPPYCVAAPFAESFDSEVDWRSPNFFMDLFSRPSHHRTYRDEWTTLGYTDAQWKLLARRAMEQSALVESAVTRLLDSLETLGLMDNTIVVITADHGDAVGSNGGVANKGGLLTEETVRIPMMIRAPGVVPGDRLGPVTNVDVAPTLLELAGLKPASHLQGAGLADALFNPGQKTTRGVMLEHYGLHERVVQRAWLDGRWKYVAQQDGFEELYDLSVDPAEMHNLAQDSDHKVTVENMREALRTEMKRLKDPELSSFG